MNKTSRVRASSTQTPGARLLWSSWLMVPLVLLSMVFTFVVSAVLLGLANLEGSEPMSEQGLVGWAQVLLAMVLGPLPAYFGVWFGSRAHRLGEGASAVAAVAANALVIAGIWLLIVVTTLNQL
ncbi:MAG: hypothetical protein OEV62_01570 [Actinomycetota bacterium]|nr:hypothetical protein [Actinomycetota bacterium]MDH5278762.1 hypothetical protein [Actinomycetota bacterium]